MRDRVNKLSRSGSAIGVDDSNVIGIIIEQTERSLNIITGHFAISLWSNLGNHLGNVPVRWHQDPPFGAPTWPNTHPIPNIDADIYLDHSTVDNGCVWAIPGYHLVGHVQFENFTDQELFTQMGAVPIELGPGDVSFHCLLAPHGSRGNQSASLRRTFYIHFMNQSVLDE